MNYGILRIFLFISHNSGAAYRNAGTKKLLKDFEMGSDVLSVNWTSSLHTFCHVQHQVPAPQGAQGTNR
jgi:hypothetical protein